MNVAAILTTVARCSINASLTLKVWPNVTILRVPEKEEGKNRLATRLYKPDQASSSANLFHSFQYHVS